MKYINTSNEQPSIRTNEHQSSSCLAGEKFIKKKSTIPSDVTPKPAAERSSNKMSSSKIYSIFGIEDPCDKYLRSLKNSETSQSAEKEAKTKINIRKNRIKKVKTPQVRMENLI